MNGSRVFYGVILFVEYDISKAVCNDFYVNVLCDSHSCHILVTLLISHSGKLYGGVGHHLVFHLNSLFHNYADKSAFCVVTIR